MKSMRQPWCQTRRNAWAGLENANSVRDCGELRGQRREQGILRMSEQSQNISAESWLWTPD